MELNKKGIFFTFAAIALSIIIILSFNVYTDYRLNDQMGPIEIRIDTMNNFIKDLENDIGNAIFIAGFRSLLSLEDYMMDHDEFFNAVDTPTLANAFDEVFRLGTIQYGTGTEKMLLMNNNTFLNWTDRMKLQSTRTNIKLEFNIDSVTISQSDPWAVDVTVRLDIDVKDEKNTASWTINNKDYTKKINITSLTGVKKFVDPLYLVNNNGLVNNTITITTVPDFSSSANLNTHLINSYYIEHSDAPSYLMRFENNLGSSSQGIESLVNSQKLIDKGVTTYDRSAVDYIYYGSGITTNCKIVDFESLDWFKLDSSHLGFYGATCIP
ncbi:MAG: hypothetical protein IH934_01010 [Nanoarchaeota archaeon]|nr:hypothetical protein [Nanoarchaeota archaeon]